MIKFQVLHLVKAPHAKESGIGALVFELCGIKQNEVHESDGDAVASLFLDHGLE